MAIFLTFFLILSFLIIILFIVGSSQSISLGGVDFIAKGKEAGLTAKEIKMLKKTADILKLEKPLILLGSINNIDDAILKLNSKLQDCDYHDLEIIDLLEDLHNYRRNIELEKLDKRGVISSSREMSVSQEVKITVGSMEIPIVGVVSDITQNFITIDLKNETGVRPGVNWNGPINIYFWRRDDAGYYFESKVIETPGILKWNVSHSSNLIRSQKRSDLRVDYETNCYIYKLEDITKRNYNFQGFTGTFAQLKNISEGGAAFLVNGKVQPGLPLKMEFKLDNKNIVLCGLVKDSSYNQSNNISYVRVKVVDPPFEMLSILRPFLFIKSREINLINKNKVDNSVENIDEINNNNNHVVDREEITENEAEEEILEVEYLPESSGALN